MACAIAANWVAAALATPLRHPSAMAADMGSGKMSSSPFSIPSKMACATCAVAFGAESSGHLGVRRTGQDRVHTHALFGAERAHRLGHRERRRLGDRISGDQRKGGQAVHRQIVDDGPVSTSQQREEGLGDVERPEQVDVELPLYGRLDQVVVERHTRVVDQDGERADRLDGFADLFRIGDVQPERRDPDVGVGNGHPHAGVDVGTTSPSTIRPRWHP